MGSIFAKDSKKVQLISEENNNLDTLVDEIKDIGRELLIQRKANEAFVYGEEVEDNEDVDLDDVSPKESE